MGVKDGFYYTGIIMNMQYNTAFFHMYIVIFMLLTCAVCVFFVVELQFIAT